MKAKIFKKLRFLSSITAGTLVTTITLSACGNNNNSVFIYNNLKTSVNNFWKKTYKTWQDQNSSKGFIAFYNDPTNNFSNRSKLMYQVSTMTTYPDTSLNAYIIKQIQNNKNFFDATTSWNQANFVQLITNSILRYFLLFYLTALSWLQQKNQALNDLNTSTTKVGKTSAVCEYLQFLKTTNGISGADYNFWLLQLRDFYNHGNKAVGTLKNFVTSGFDGFSINLPTLSSAVQPKQTVPFSYKYDVKLQSHYVAITNHFLYSKDTQTYKNEDTSFNILNESTLPTKSNLTPGNLTLSAASSLWSEFQKQKAASKDPDYDFNAFLNTAVEVAKFNGYAEQLFGNFADFQKKITADVSNSKNFTFSGEGAKWTTAQKANFANGISNQLLWWAKTAVVIVMCYEYDRAATLQAAAALSLQTNSIYGAYFQYALDQKVFTANDAQTNLSSSLRTLFSGNLKTIFISNDYSALPKNFLFYLMVSDNLADITVSSSQPVTVAYAAGVMLPDFGLNIKFDNITINYSTDIALSANEAKLTNINNFLSH